MPNHLQVTLEIITHATENEKLILQSIHEFFNIQEVEFSKQNLFGHFENPILLSKVKLVKKNARDFVHKLVENIPKYQIEQLLNDIESHIDGSALFLRISKQDILRKSITLQEKDVIRIKISTQVYRKNDVAKTYVNLLSPPASN